MCPDCVVSPLARPGVSHPEHQVTLHGTDIGPAHRGGSLLQPWDQRPHLRQHRDEELVGVLRTHTHTGRFEKRGSNAERRRHEAMLAHLLAVISEQRIPRRHRPLERNEEADFMKVILGEVRYGDVHK